MSPSVEQLVERAWRALWRDGSPYHLPTAFQHGRLSGHIRVRPLASLRLPDVSDVVLFDRAPWGGVTVSLRDSHLEGLNTIAGTSCDFNAGGGTIAAGLKFSGLRLAGAHVLQAGHRTGAALGAAIASLQGGAGDTDDGNITLAKSYESQLIGMQSDSGRVMVSAYYQNNDTYAELFQMPNFVKAWSQHTTNNQTTKFYANQTSLAAQPENVNTVSVNGQPDAQGFSPYNSHAYYMQTLVMAICYKIADASTSTDKAKRYSKAGDDAEKFGVPTKTQSNTSQTVGQVLKTVADSTPPTREGLKAVVQQEEPQWLKDVRAKAQAMAADIVQQDLIEGINSAALAKPAQGVYSGNVPDVDFTLTGRITPHGPGGHPAVTFTRLDGPPLEIEIALGNVDTMLGSEVGGALARARFLKRLLGHRAAAALTSTRMLRYLSRQMNLALAQRLGATG